MSGPADDVDPLALCVPTLDVPALEAFGSTRTDVSVKVAGIDAASVDSVRIVVEGAAMAGADGGEAVPVRAGASRYWT